MKCWRQHLTTSPCPFKSITCFIMRDQAIPKIRFSVSFRFDIKKDTKIASSKEAAQTNTSNWAKSGVLGIEGQEIKGAETQVI